MENKNYNTTKPFKRGAMPNGQFIDAKSFETSMLKDQEDVKGLEPSTRSTQHHKFYWTHASYIARLITMRPLVKDRSC